MGNPMFHWELMVNDVDKAIDFYSKVFDWEIDRSSFPNYPLIKTGSNPGGGILKKPEMVPNPALNIYFHTEDIEDTLTRATVTGATIVSAKTTIPGMGFWAIFADPDGTPIGVMQME
ncbi:MAG TPA: VOC family protein [Thermoleophilia bacterium]|nr:VOC family protein [Thermoleophilia bacterium]